MSTNLLYKITQTIYSLSTLTKLVFVFRFLTYRLRFKKKSYFFTHYKTMSGIGSSTDYFLSFSVEGQHYNNKINVTLAEQAAPSVTDAAQ